jgi:CelD/BcsL family acetyltransferase involved in cellulose biosynthesis
MLMKVNPEYTVTQETFDSIHACWRDPKLPLEWDCLFVLPGWLKVWWDQFAADQVAHLCAVRNKGELIGIAPLMIEGKTARLMGDPEVCDFVDVITVPGRGRAFFQNLIPYIQKQGATRLDIGAVRADSVVFTDLVEVAKDLGYETICDPADVTMVLDLPTSWDDYLNQLTGKERHEIRRKLRRLNEAAQVSFRVVKDPDGVAKEIGTFLALFKLNRWDKLVFMSDQRTAFFRELALAMAAARILRLYFLDLDDVPAAAAMCFDYRSTIYLYNNGYDMRYKSLSVGLLCAVFTIKESIQKGKARYDFLKGPEPYKRRFGGKPVQLYRCQVKLG